MNRSELRKLAFELQATNESNLVAVAGILDAIKNYLSKATRGFFFEERYRFQKSNEILKVHVENIQSILTQLNESIESNNFNEYTHNLTVLKSEMQELLKWMAAHRSDVKTVQDAAKDTMNAQVAALPPEKKDELREEIKQVKEQTAPEVAAEPAVEEPTLIDTPSGPRPSGVQPSSLSKVLHGTGLNDFMNELRPWTALNTQILGQSDAFKGIVDEADIYISDNVFLYFCNAIKLAFGKDVQFKNKEDIKSVIRRMIFNGSMQRWSIQHSYAGAPAGRVYVTFDVADVAELPSTKVKMVFKCKFALNHERIEVTNVYPQVVPLTGPVAETREKAKADRRDEKEKQKKIKEDAKKAKAPSETEVKSAFDYYVNNQWFKKANASARYLVDVFGTDVAFASEFAYLLKVALRQNHRVIAHIHTNGDAFEVEIPFIDASESDIFKLAQEINKELHNVTNSYAQFYVAKNSFPKFAQLDFERAEQFSRMFTLAYAKKAV